MSYSRFALMIATSTVVMFGLMYLNTYALEHVFFSETRGYMALVMGAAMAPIMLLFMWGMYKGRGTKIAILAASAVVFAGALLLVRSQVTVDGVSYMRAMIPHHSIAIMTSERAGIEDPRVRKLARGIVEAQEREIAEMRYLIANIGQNGEAAEIYRDPEARPGSLGDALANTLRAGLDPAQMSDREIGETVAAPACRFRQTEAAAPILVSGHEGAGMKLNGILLRLAPTGDTAWQTEGASVTVTPEADPGPRADAEMIFALQDGPTVGYRGFWHCDG
ncbi:DUF6692 family protein [Frigidibacter sp. MR17.24]|uniref:DUF6692 family protein n=1 Tax=Frigidibacter sp. MR17.24 TaxID=3127345 RepID=UPI003012C0AF